MTSKELKETLDTVKFKIIDIEIKSFSETDYKEFGLEESNIKEGGCNVGFNLNIDDKKGIIALPILAEFFPNKKKKECKLFSIETVHRFKLKDFKELLKKNKNGLYNLPDSLLLHLLGIAIGGTRGMIVASIKIPEYKKIILPLVITSHLLDIYKQQAKKDS